MLKAIGNYFTGNDLLLKDYSKEDILTIRVTNFLALLILSSLALMEVLLLALNVYPNFWLNFPSIWFLAVIPFSIRVGWHKLSKIILVLLLLFQAVYLNYIFENDTFQEVYFFCLVLLTFLIFNSREWAFRLVFALLSLLLLLTVNSFELDLFQQVDQSQPNMIIYRWIAVIYALFLGCCSLIFYTKAQEKEALFFKGKLKLSEEKLTSAQADIKKYKEYFNHTPFAIVITNIDDASIVFANRKAREIFEIDLEMLESFKGQKKALSFYKSKSDRDAVLNELKQNKTIENKLLPFITAKGNEIWCELTISFIQIGDEKYILTLVVDSSVKVSESKIIQRNKGILEKIFNEVDDAIFLIDQETRLVIDCNQRALDLFKFEGKKDIIGTSGWQLNETKFTDEELAIINKNFDESGRFGGDFTFVRKDNTTFWGNLSSSKILVEGEYFIYVRIFDISNQISTSKKLEDSNLQLKLALKAANLGVFELDLSNHKLQWDNQLYEIFEVDPLTFVPDLDHFLAMVDPNQKQIAYSEAAIAAANEDILESEFKIITPKGNSKYIKSNAKVIRDTNGVPIRLIGLNKDITGTKLFEQSIQNDKIRAELESQSKAQFLSIMSHEIRTPLNGVIGLAHLLLEDNPKPDQIDNLKSLEISSAHLLSLINDILDFSKIEAGKIEIESSPFSLDNVLLNQGRVFQFRAQEKEISLQIIPSNLPYEVLGDITRLNQIINNLLGNAVKFTDKGSVTLKASIVSETLDWVKVKIDVTDTGIGIPIEKQEQIFDAFSQATYETSRLYGGTGLGLAITKKLVALLEGELHLTTEVGVGSTFSVVLAFKKGALLANNDAIPSHALKGHDFSKFRVLLVEDNPVNMLVASKFLKNWKIPYSTATNGIEAMDLFKHETFNLVLMDLHMPKMDGYEALEAIRKIDLHIPVIALTADAFLEVKARALKNGFNGFITKPFNPKELYNTLLAFDKN